MPVEETSKKIEQMSLETQPPAAPVEVESSEQPVNYVVNKEAPKTVQELLEKDAEDESLRRYKERLLGSAASQGNSPTPTDPRNIVPNSLKICFEDSKIEDIVFEGLENLTPKIEFKLKEGTKYKFELTFMVQHMLLAGLQFSLKVTRTKALGLLKNSEKVPMGSFAPKIESQTFTFPREDFLEAPKGVVNRGAYSGKFSVKDVDGVKHLELPFAFQITK